MESFKFRNIADLVYEMDHEIDQVLQNVRDDVLLDDGLTRDDCAAVLDIKDAADELCAGRISKAEFERRVCKSVMISRQQQSGIYQ